MKQQLKRIKQQVRQLVGYKPPIKAKSDPLPNRILAAESIAGWFSRRESRRLDMTAAMSTGPVLEIGHFLGRSTACICEAIRDVRKPRVFRVVRPRVSLERGVQGVLRPRAQGRSRRAAAVRGDRLLQKHDHH